MNGRKKRTFTCTKPQALKLHSKKRAATRYDGVVLSNSDLRAIVQKIKSGKGTFVEKKTNRVTEWEVSHMDILWHVLYDKERHMLITCLPPRAEAR